MHFSKGLVLLFSFCFTSTFASFLTGTYPAPIDLASNASVVAANWKNLSRIFDNSLRGNSATNAADAFAAARNVSFSVGLFSIHDPAASKLQYHHTSPQTANAPNGTNIVNGDSIYRVASVSKLFTVYAGILNLAEEDWNSPISEIIPELTTADSENGSAYTIDWDEITPWALATQLAGIPQFGIAAGDLLFAFEEAASLKGGSSSDSAIALGLPPLDISVLGPCLNFTCGVAAFAESYRTQTPEFQSFTSPGYSDGAFMLLGMVISTITGRPMESVYRQSIFEPLGMASSNSTTPTGVDDLARCVITDNSFYLEGGLTSPSGGIFSSLNDLNKFGVALLNSTLLPSNVTRKWMKPVTHTPSLTYSVGGPWEIHRYIHPVTGKITDLYTKLGDSGSSGGATVLIPEYGAGISFAGASSDVIRSDVDNIVLDSVINAILPALEAQAAVEAGLNYIGTYNSTDRNLNSSVTISLDKSTAPGKPKGLSVSRWISNGTDVLLEAFKGVHPVLLPSIPKPNEGPGPVAFQISTSLQTNSYAAAPKSAGVIGPFTGAYGTNIDWMVAGNQYYGGVGVKLFVFDVNAEGMATALSPAVARIKLQRRG
ncbi:hypothetical protein H2200_005863 [Cladophialophora chaetospira]|uniref:Beta-lactamase-related domain-containing protein n=1 Tax=Cladophialophora chaetospira TaxID=386627 RepID=A0AA38X9Z7_9EURO|nr:hypothetical protein H2200_005863 [Cladophialophora chaetospira]